MTMRNPSPFLLVALLVGPILYIHAALPSDGEPDWAAELPTPSQAMKDAARDIASGNIRIYYFSGGIDPRDSPVGILDDQQHLMEAYPKEMVGAGGCVIGDDDLRMYEYAEAYNAEIIKHVSKK